MAWGERVFGVLLLGVGIYHLSRGAYSSGQKDWIHRRDGNKCQAKPRHNCGGTPEGNKNPIHHILGQRYCYNLGVDPDYPENGLEVCQNFHDLVHPDVPEARRNYHKDPDAFKKLGEERNEKLKNRQIPWNSEYDRCLQITAVRNTQRYEQEHPEDRFPVKRRKQV